MTRSVQRPCRAKINLFLEVLGKREDGYHEILTLMQEVSLEDRVQVRMGEDGAISFRTDSGEIPAGEENLVVRAARQYLDHWKEKSGLDIHLQKEIPHGAGLGGGSSDASATLLALDEFFGRTTPPDALQKLTAGLGSDCPFFLHGGLAECRGRGEQVMPRESLPSYGLLIICPAFHTSTASVYKSLNIPFLEQAPGVDLVLEELRSGDLDRVRAAVFNRLEVAALNLQPELHDFRRELVSLGVPEPRLAGSGSSFFSIFSNLEQARQVQADLKQQLGEQQRGVFAASFCGGQVH